MNINCIVHQDANGDLCIFQSDMSAYGYVPVGPVNVQYEVPADFNPTAAKIGALEKKRNTLSDEYRKKYDAIQNAIVNLQCLENSPAGAA